MKTNFQEIKLSEAYESLTNPRGKNFEGPAFEDLVASIKEKGVLVPVIVRMNPQKINGKIISYEVIAGSRRLRASKLAGLDSIPAKVVEINDAEAREVQIIENLQREDIHPIEEGKSYRQLMEKSKYEVATIAAKVGKSDSYVRQRLFLTNLIDKAATAYRSGKILDGHAVLIAKLSENDQKATLKWIEDEWEMPTVKELKEWIEKTFYNQLDNQPWLKDKAANEAVGKCVECKPNSLSLFGEVKEGACTDLKCWKRKMDKYIDYRMGKEGVSVKVSKQYGSTDSKNVLSRSNYEMLSTNKKKHCEFAEKAMVTEGEDLGTIVYICRDSKCKIHHSSHSEYALTPEEKQKRREESKKEKEKEDTRKAKENKEILDSLEKVTLPLSHNITNLMIDMMIGDSREDELKPICERHAWEPVIKEEKTWDSKKIMKCKDWSATVKKQAEDMTIDEQLRLVFELMMQTVWSEPRNKVIKALNGK